MNRKIVSGLILTLLFIVMLTMAHTHGIQSVEVERLDSEAGTMILPSTLDSSFVNVSVSNAKNMIDSIEDLVVIDVRNKEEYSKGHITNAILVPLSTIEDRIEELDKLGEMLIYCKSGKRSTAASRILVENEFVKVFNMLGGIKAWEDAGYIITIPAEDNGEADGSYVPNGLEALEEKGAKWTEGETSVSGLSWDRKQSLCGDIGTTVTIGHEISLESYPSSFDWRSDGGYDWTTPIRDQESCGSCYIFGSLAVVEAMNNIEYEDPDIDVNLSEQYVLSCCSICGDCGGGYSTEVLEFTRTTGVPDEACFPYQADDDVPCSSACPDWESRATKIIDWGHITLTKENIIAHLLNGPVTAGMRVYADFYSYSGGIYEHMWGSYVGNHLVAIVGYNDIDGYWICKNSWGTGWGEDGWFKIKYGECSIESSHMEYVFGIVQGQKVDTVLDFWFQPNPANPSQTVELYGSLTELGDGPVFPASVILEYSSDGGATWNYGLTLNTNSTGDFSLTFTAPRVGEYLVRVSYEGSDTYNPSSHTETLTIQLQELASIDIWTDKPIYSVGETMYVYIRVENLGSALPVRLTIKAGLPGGGMYGPVLDVTTTLPAGFDSGTYFWNSFTISSMTLGTYTWIAELRNPTTGALIDSDTWTWTVT